MMTGLDPSVPDAGQFVQCLGTDPDSGLPSAEATRRLRETGTNELQTAAPVSRWRRLVEQFRDPLIYLLLAAVVISLVAWTADGASGWPVDTIVIVAIVALNGVLGYLQQARAERALDALRTIGAPVGTVVRDGVPVRVPARNVVPGDVLLLAAGDMVAADARLLSSSDLEVTEAPLTGVSAPVLKDARAVPAESAEPARSVVFSGTAVTRGAGTAVVTATGMGTRIGGIAGLVHASRQTPSPLQREVARVGRLLGAAVLVIAAVVVAAILLVVGVHSVHDVVTALLFGVSLAVAAVPEGLPALLAVVLALGVRRMARHHAIVMKLASVQALGSASVVCAGKTGTLTTGEPSIARVVSPCGEVTVPDATQENRPSRGGPALRQAALVLELAGLDSDEPPGEPGSEATTQAGSVEAACQVAQSRLGTGNDNRRFRHIGDLPFCSEHPLATSLASDRTRSGDITGVTREAPGVLLDHCTQVLVDGHVEPLDQRWREHIEQDVARLSNEAFRTVAVAYRPLEQATPRAVGESDEERLTYVGLLGVTDPPRPEAIAAIDQAHRAGVRVIMVTGDRSGTAVPMAHELGIGTQEQGAVSGAELEKLDDDQLRQTVRRRSVYVAVTPEQKLRIVDALHANHEVVAVTGSGVNDAPAVKSADVGVAMGRAGAEITKDAAKLILADDNFATIVEAIRAGRGIFSNIKKFLRYLISSNIGEVLTVFLGVVLAQVIGLTGAEGTVVLPVLATQLLWINLLTDSTPALALGVDPETEQLMRRPPRPLQDRVIDRRMWQGALVIGFAMALATLGTLDLYLPGGLIDGHQTVDNARTAGFTVLVLAQMFNTLNARSETASAFRRLFTNRWLWAAIAVSTLLQVAVVEVPFFNQAFTTTALSWKQWLICTVMASTVLWVSEARKLVLRRAGSGPSASGRQDAAAPQTGQPRPHGLSGDVEVLVSPSGRCR